VYRHIGCAAPETRPLGSGFFAPSLSQDFTRTLASCFQNRQLAKVLSPSRSDPHRSPTYLGPPEDQAIDSAEPQRQTAAGDWVPLEMLPNAE